MFPIFKKGINYISNLIKTNGKINNWKEIMTEIN